MLIRSLSLLLTVGSQIKINRQKQSYILLFRLLEIGQQISEQHTKQLLPYLS